MTHKPVLSLDFDGVIHAYSSSWQGPAIISDGPVSGAFEFIEEALEFFDVHIHSSRCNSPAGLNAMRRWFDKHGMDSVISEQIVYAVQKPPAFVTLDDRAVTFKGTFPSAAALREFKPWNGACR